MRRFGGTSVEHIERETSIASRIEVELREKVTSAVGRATPTPSTSRLATSSAEGDPALPVGVSRDRGPDRGHVRHAHRELAPPAAHQPQRPSSTGTASERDAAPTAR